MGFQRAVREKLWVKIMIGGPSGSGKSYSALRLAKGLAEACGSDIAVVDTENGRIRYYADEFQFDDMQLAAPFTPEKYIDAIDTAVDNGYKVLILDSSSHEWNWCLETHDKMPGNSYTNWGKITPRHDAFMEKILQAPCHIICTARGKDVYTLEEKNGKQTPKKVGVGIKQREDTEYNYTVTFNLDQETHIATATKDNTHLFEGRYEKLTEKDGANIYKWANSGNDPAPKKKTETPPPATTTTDSEFDVEKAHEEIGNKIAKLIDGGIDRADIGVAVKRAAGTANYKKVTDEAALKNIQAELKKMGGTEE